MLAEHMDEIGFIVKLITEEGFIRFSPLGGWWGHVMLAQRVTIKTRKGDVTGLIGSKPPHILSDEERKKLLEPKEPRSLRFHTSLIWSNEEEPTLGRFICTVAVFRTWSSAFRPGTSIATQASSTGTITTKP